MKQRTNLISKLFFSLLPVQILIFAMGYINTIVDGVMAGQFIDSATVGVIGLYYAMINVISALGAILLGGTTVVCGRYLGRGDIEKTNGIFSLNLSVTFAIAALLTIVSFLFPGPLADMLGASEDLKKDLMIYIMGYAVGIIPQMMAQQIASFLQMERQDKRGYFGIGCMVVTNVILDALFVAVLRKGVGGLVIATSISNWVYFLILAPYYLTSKSQLKFNIKNITWRSLPEIVKIGLPGALLVFCIAIRSIILNRLLLHYSGNDGLSAISAYNMILGVFIAFSVASGSVVRMLTSVFVGEEDKLSIKRVMKTALTKGMAVAVAITVAAVLASPFLVLLFFPDRTSEVYHLTYQLFVIYALCIPLIQFIEVASNYLQAKGHSVYVNVVSLMDGLISVVVPAAILAPVMGALGVWLSNPIGMVITSLTILVCVVLYWKRWPRTVDEWMLFSPDFGVSEENCLDIPIRDVNDVSNTSSLVQEFCDAHDMAARPSYYAALCLEEMAGNVIKHGFTSDKKGHYLNARAVYLDDTVLLRLKDDCPTFDPLQMKSFATAAKDFESIGLKMVYELADEVSYQNLLGLNVLTVRIQEENIAAMDVNDYLLERRLKELNPQLHQIFKDSAFVAQEMLNKYTSLFPEFTDHSQFHSLTVIDSCNRIIGRDQIDKLNEDEVFVLLMACYLHDIGMGIGDKDYEKFKDVLGADEYFSEHPGASEADFVRAKHNEFSGLLIDKYAALFDLPSEEYVFAVKQVARGHRKTDLYDEKEYPADYKLPNGNTVCLPYLAALLRLSDEIDVAASRNPIILYDVDYVERLSTEVALIETKKLMAVERVRMTKSAFIIESASDEKDVLDAIDKMIVKMQETLDLCRDVVEKRTDFVVSQKRVVLRNRVKE